jgi:NADH:ubiquinone oxidoreductase subunit C
VIRDDDTLTLRLRSVSLLTQLVTFLRYSSLTRLSTLIEYTLVDVPTTSKRFRIVLFLLSTEYNYRIVVTSSIGVLDFVPSLTGLLNSSGWAEREMRDMFGIYFTDNSDLRRLLTDYGFQGFPLRKDFPLTGYTEVRYDDEKQQILYEPLQLSQEFRIFSLTNPWERKGLKLNK